MGILEKIDINLAILDNIDTYFNIDKNSLENIGINKGILQDIDKLLYC